MPPPPRISRVYRADGGRRRSTPCCALPPSAPTRSYLCCTFVGPILLVLVRRRRALRPHRRIQNRMEGGPRSCVRPLPLTHFPSPFPPSSPYLNAWCVPSRPLSPPFFYRKEGGSQIRPRPTDRPVDLRAISVAPIRRSPVCHVSRSTVSLAARRTKEEKRLWNPLPPIKNAKRDIRISSQGQSCIKIFFIMHLKEVKDRTDRTGRELLNCIFWQLKKEGFLLRRVQSFAICAFFPSSCCISTAPFKKKFSV